MQWRSYKKRKFFISKLFTEVKTKMTERRFSCAANRRQKVSLNRTERRVAVCTRWTQEQIYVCDEARRHTYVRGQTKKISPYQIRQDNMNMQQKGAQSPLTWRTESTFWYWDVLYYMIYLKSNPWIFTCKRANRRTYEAQCHANEYRCDLRRHRPTS